MNTNTPLKIDAYAHIITPRYHARVTELLTTARDARSQAFLRMLGKDPSLCDLAARLQIMDEIGPEYRQVLTTGLTSAEYLDTSINVELAKLANAEMAELVATHPDRFRGWVAQAPLLDMDATISELDRAFAGRALGAQINTHIGGLPLDHPSFEPFYEFMAAAKRPIWVHPNRGLAQSEFPEAEDISRYGLYSKTGWPTDTTNGMLRLTYSGIFDRWPELRVLTHHAGGTIPMIAGRLKEPPAELVGTEPLIPLKRLFADTAAFGNPIAVRAALEFFGDTNVVFGTDFGFTSTFAPRTIESVLTVIDDPALLDRVFHANFEAMVGEN